MKKFIVLFIGLILSTSFAQSQYPPCYYMTNDTCNCNSLYGDIPPTSVPWIAMGPTEVEVEINGETCLWCVKYCYRQAVPEVACYDLVMCAHSGDTDCPENGNDDFWNLPQGDRYVIIAKALMATDPDNVFNLLPECPTTQESFNLFWVRCFNYVTDEVCTGSSAFCKLVYSACRVVGGKNVLTYLRTETVTLENCDGDCEPLECPNP